MLMHEKLMSGQFLLDLKNDRSGLLQAAAVAHHHQQQQQPLHHLQPPSPPMPALDIYSAYAYQQQLQQQLLNSHHLTASANHQQPTAQTPSAEVLDLSRRDSVEATRKTPSPYHTNSSFGSGSPSGSPNSFLAQQQQQQQNAAASLLPANLLYAAQTQQQNQQTQQNLQIPANLAALYPGLYYPAVKQEPMSTTPPPTSVPVSQPAPALANNNLLQSFASAAAVAAAASNLKHDLPEPHSPQQNPHSSSNATTPTSSTSTLASMDSKNTPRPFKAFPRDPLVIAANFAATDVLLDNPRVERYTEYRKRVLEQIRSSNGGSRTVTNPKMRRTNSASGSIHEGSSSNNSENDERQLEESSDCDSNSGHDNQSMANGKSQDNNTNVSGSGGVVKDAAYYERRRKNNAAAKKSRDRRRIKEDEIAIRAAYLERQNIELLCQIDALKAQLSALTSKMS